MAVLSGLFFKSLFVVSLFKSTNLVKKPSDMILHLKSKHLWSVAKLSSQRFRITSTNTRLQFSSFSFLQGP